MPTLITQLERQSRRDCLLCGAKRRAGRPLFVAAWYPDPETSKRFGFPTGKRPRISYTLCARCRRQPGVATRVEDRILADADAMRGTVEAN